MSGNALGPTLTTERLILRVPQADELDGWAAMAAEEATMRHLGGVKSKAEAWRGLCEMIGSWHVAGFGMFSMIERASGEWIGRVGPWHPYGWPGDEVGWGIRAPWRGQGLAYEAAVASLDFAFETLGWERVIHTIAPDNGESQRLAMRLGSTNLRPTQLPPPFADVRVDAWGQSREQWRARRSSGSA